MSMMRLRPLNDRLIVRRANNQRQTPSGIVIPDTATEKPDQGTVVAVGPGKQLEDGTRVPVGLNVNDDVLFGKYAGQTVKVDEEEFLVIREEDVFAVILPSQQ